MGWKITHDLINTGPDERSYVGRFQGELKGETYTARLLDDDLVHYYTVTFDREAFENDEERGGLYCLYEWAMYDVGVTNLAIHLNTFRKMGCDERTMATYEQIAWKRGDHKGWCTIYA